MVSHPFAEYAKGWGTQTFMVRSRAGRRPIRPLIAETAMNGAQLIMTQSDSSGLMSGPPATQIYDWSDVSHPPH
jgi:hypothetical protein